MTAEIALPTFRPEPAPPPAAPPARPVAAIVLVHVAALAAWAGAYAGNGPFSKLFTYRLLGLTPGTHLASAVEFFVFEVPKVLLLLTLVVFVVGIVRSFFTPEKTRSLLAGRRETAGNVLASLLGIVTPFCSCSAVPMFIGFVTAGVPLGVTFSFLVAAPMVNEIALALLFGLFGWKVAGLYLATGLLIAFTSGWVIGKLKLEKWVEPWVYAMKGPAGSFTEEKIGWERRLEIGREQVGEIVGRSGSTSSPASPSAPGSTAGSPRTSWPRSWARAPGGPCRSPSSSASRCTRTRPESSRSFRPSSARAPRSERSWRS